jgi:hypothetical protein
MSSCNPVTRLRANVLKEAAPRLAELADKAKTLGRRLLDDVIELGAVLAEARSISGHGNWLKWLEDLGLSADTAQRFMDVSEFSKSRNLRKLELLIPLSAIYILARQSTPEGARDAVFTRLDAGEKVSVTDVRRAVTVRVTHRTDRIVVPYRVTNDAPEAGEREANYPGRRAHSPHTRLRPGSVRLNCPSPGRRAHSPLRRRAPLRRPP